MKVSPLATYFNHFRRKYLNFEFVILNFELRTQCDKHQFETATGYILAMLAHEEQGQRSGAGVGSNHRAQIAHEHFLHARTLQHQSL